MNVLRLILNLTLITSLLVNSAGWGCLCPAQPVGALRPIATGIDEDSRDTAAGQMKIELTVSGNSLIARNPQLFQIFTKPTELAIVPMVSALAEHSSKYLPKRSLKLFYPAAGWDMSAVYVALELIETGKIDSADLFFADMVPIDMVSAPVWIEKMRPFVEGLKVEKTEDSFRISFSYRGKRINLTYYEGRDRDVLSRLPGDLNLLYFHAHGSEGGMDHSVIPPIWEAFVRHCEGPITIFSHAYPGTLLELISDWCAYTPLQFDRWQTVIPRYEGGAAFGLDRPVDLGLIKNAWGGLQSDEDLKANPSVPSEDTDRLVAFKALNKLKSTVPGLDEAARANLKEFFNRQAIPPEEGSKIVNAVASGRNFEGLRNADPGLCFDITHHSVAATLRGLGIDLNKPTEGRLRQVEDKLKSAELNNKERIFLMKTLWYAGRGVEPSILLDLIEELYAEDELAAIDTAISQSRRFFDAKPILEEAAKRIEYAHDLRLIKRYLWFCVGFEGKDVNKVLDKHPRAKDKLFRVCLDKAYEVAGKSSLNAEGFLRCIDSAELLLIIDLNRTLNFIKSPDSEKELTKGISPELIDRIFFPIMLQIDRLFDGKLRLTKEQKELIDSIYEKYQWPKRIKRWKLSKHRNYAANARLCAYLEQTLGQEYRETIDAMRANPRCLFLTTIAEAWAYLDKALPTRNGQTISQPKVVAWMTKELKLKPGYRVLEIGTGSGWQTSILSHLVGKEGHVFTIEYDGKLAETGEGNLKRLGISNVTVYKRRDGGLGLAEEAPFDAILFTAGVPANEEKLKRMVEETLKPQIKEGGRIIFPIITKADGSDGYIMAVKKEKGQLYFRQLQRIVFTPLRGKFGLDPAAAQEEKEQSTDSQKSSSAGRSPEPLLHFPKWLQEELEPVLVDRLGREAASFLLKGYSFAFIGRISDIPARLKKRLGPVRYFNNRIIVCENALSSVADIFKKEIPRYESLSVKSVKRELLQVALYYAELELKIRQRELNFDKLKEQILKIYGETKVRSPEFRLFLKGFRRQYGDRFRKDTELLRKLITHLIAEVVLFGNLPKVILDSSGRPGEEEDINREIVRSCIRFIEEAGLVSGEEIRRLKELAKKGGASKREKKKMLLNIFDFISRKEMMEKINRALDEDKQKEDSATQHTIRDDQQATAVIEAQQNGILAGLEIARLVFEMVDEELEVEPLLSDGDELTPGKPILIVRGNARSIIGAERLVLNYLQTLSGIATLTAEFVKPTAGTNVKILDTRKTFPEMRPLQKYAVRVGGGKNHRMDLKEMVIIKDTHLALIRQELGRDEGIIAEAVNRVRSAPEGKNLFVEVEVRDIDGAKEALQNGVDRIMLDNMSCADMKRVVRFIRRSRYYRLHAKPTIEASGNVGLKTAEGFNRVTRTVEEVVGTGVDYISVGLITRAAPSLDIHLEIRPEFKEMDINELIKRLTGAAEIPKVTAERAESGRGKEKKVSAEKPQNLRKLHELIENNA